MDNSSCASCHASIASSYYFCPNCGKKLREKLLPITIGRQINIYLWSFFIPPSGLWWAWKLFRQHDQTAIKVAVAAIVITVISLALTIVTVESSIRLFNQALNTQLNGSNSLGL